MCTGLYKIGCLNENVIRYLWKKERCVITLLRGFGFNVRVKVYDSHFMLYVEMC